MYERSQVAERMMTDNDLGGILAESLRKAIRECGRAVPGMEGDGSELRAQYLAGVMASVVLAIVRCGGPTDAADIEELSYGLLPGEAFVPRPQRAHSVV